jgi:putative sterol carrier protein
MSRVETVEGYFQTISDRFNADKADSLEMTFQYLLTASNGPIQKHIIIKEKKITVCDGCHPSPDATMETSESCFLDLVNSRTTGWWAVTTLKLKILGNLVLARNLEAVLPHEKGS